LKVEKAKTLDYVCFQELPVGAAAVDFVNAIKDLERGNFDGLAVHLVNDARKLCEEKGETLTGALRVVKDRLVSQLQEPIVAWKSFVIETEDVARIKSTLIGNPLHEKLLPGLRSLESFSKYAPPLFSAFGKAYDACAVDKLTSEALLQLGACAICSGIYITAVSSAKASTKVKAVKQGKALLAKLNIQLPIELMARHADVVSRLEAAEKRERAEDAAAALKAAKRQRTA